MPTFVNNWLDYSDVSDTYKLKLFTGNNYIRKDGALVMGRGAALEVKNAHPQIAYELGKKISGLDKIYGLALSDTLPIGVFQVKTNFRFNAHVDIIKHSVEKLKEYLSTQSPLKLVHMNYPGIGYGGLPKMIVEPLLANLPENVVIFDGNNWDLK